MKEQCEKLVHLLVCILLPLRFIAENLGCKVDWDQSTQTVTVTYPAS